MSKAKPVITAVLMASIGVLVVGRRSVGPNLATVHGERPNHKDVHADDDRCPDWIGRHEAQVHDRVHRSKTHPMALAHT